MGPLKDVMEFAMGDFGPGGRIMQAAGSLKQGARWNYAGETHAGPVRITCGEHRKGDAGEDIIKKYREAAHLVRA